MSDETTLLPCPFCGGVDTLKVAKPDVRNATPDNYLVLCCWLDGGCGASSGTRRTEAEAIAAWNTRIKLGNEINGNTSDGYHTFNELYHHRAVLFSVIVRDHRDLAWKARKHHDGTMFDGMFIVGIETPKGQATYHYDLDPYWEMFDCEELEYAPEWDGHTPDDAIARIAELGGDDDYEAKMDALLCRLTNGKWSKSRAYDLDFMVSCVDEEYEMLYARELAEQESGTCDAVRDERTQTIVCSKCGGGGLTIPNKGQKALRNFCPNCGSRIRRAAGR